MERMLRGSRERVRDTKDSWMRPTTFDASDGRRPPYFYFFPSGQTLTVRSSISMVIVICSDDSALGGASSPVVDGVQRVTSGVGNWECGTVWRCPRWRNASSSLLSGLMRSFIFLPLC
jgi:hypothetical protein